MTNSIKSRVLLYEQVKAELFRRSRRAKPDANLGSERTLAAQTGVSRITVRRALADLEKEGLIFRVAGKGTFLRSRRRKKNIPRLLAVLSFFDVYANPFHAAVFSGIQAEAHQLGYHLLVARLEGDPHSRNMVQRLAGELAVAGYFLLGGMPAELIALVTRKNKPVILVDHCLKNAALPAVMGDNESGAQEAVRHLLQLGHRRIAHPTYPVLAPSFSQRQAGWEKALRAAGQAPSRALVWDLIPGQDPEVKAIRGKIRAQSPTAIFCANDALAFKFLHTLRELNINVPDDISLVGFDDIPPAESISLTTVAVPKKELGATAVKRLVNRLHGTDCGPATTILPLRLVVRNSTAAPPGHVEMNQAENREKARCDLLTSGKKEMGSR